MPRPSIAKVASTLFAFAIIAQFASGPTKAADVPGFVRTCQKCMQIAAGESGKDAGIDGSIEAAKCLLLEEATPVAVAGCFVGGATLVGLRTLIGASLCASSPACQETVKFIGERNAILNSRTSVSCVILRTPQDSKKCAQKFESRTKTIQRNGFGTTVAETCNNWTCGEITSGKKCTDTSLKIGNTDKCPN